jgi:hypothetical protein
METRDSYEPAALGVRWFLFELTEQERTSGAERDVDSISSRPRGVGAQVRDLPVPAF